MSVDLMSVNFGTGRYNYGYIPDPPEPIECDGEFRSDVCEGCSDYDECKRIAEEEGEV